MRVTQGAAAGRTVVRVNADADTTNPELRIDLDGLLTLTAPDFLL